LNRETMILSNLILNEEYGRKVLPFLKEEYFQKRDDQTLFRLANDYIQKYNNFPSKDTLLIDLSNLKNLTGPEYDAVVAKITGLTLIEKTDPQWLLDKTEQWVSWQAIKNALFQCVKIVEKGDNDLEKGAMPKLLTDALAVSFDSNVGHDFMDDWEERFECYKKEEERVPFDIDLLNRITKGGVPKRSLNVIVAKTGVGKSLIMCHMAKANLLMQKKVLYITLEMGEIGDPSISQRIEANLLDVEVDHLRELKREVVVSRLASLKSLIGDGKLIIKGYPTASAGAGHFRFLINELRLKRNFVPDIIYIDYINNCISSRMKLSSNVGTYTYIKSIAEELRGLAQEFNVPVITATQLNREGSKHSDPELEHTAESWGIPQTVDFMIAVITNESLERSGQYLIKQLKTRYGNPADHSHFLVGVNKAKMRLYDIKTDEVVDSRTSTRATMAERNNVGSFTADALLEGT